MGTPGIPVEQINGHMSSLVAENFAKELFRTVQQSPVQTDQTIRRVAATEGSTHAGTELDADSLAELGDTPDLGPPIDPGLECFRHRDGRV